MIREKEKLIERMLDISSEESWSVSSFKYSRHKNKGKTEAWRFTPEGPPKGVVLFVHGAGGDAIYPYMSFFLELLKNNYEICSFDIDGHGQGSTTYLNKIDIFECISAAIKAFNLEEKSKNVHLVGHSLGGVLILDFLSRTNLDFKSAVVISSPIEVKVRPSMLFNEAFFFFSSIVRKQMGLFGVWEMVPPLVFFKRSKYPIRIDKVDKSRDYISLFIKIIAAAKLMSKVSEIKCPVLYAYGTRDHLALPKEGKNLHEQTCKSKLLIIKGTTHLTTVFSKTLFKELLEWLERKETK